MRNQQGLSTVELVIVSSMASLLLALSAFTISGAVAREELNSWARTIVHEIGAAQQAAVTRRSTVTATFQNQVFAVVVAGGGTIRQETLPSHLTFGATLRTITFDRRGTPGGASSITLNSTTGGPIYTILIESGTGRVSVQ